MKSKSGMTDPPKKKHPKRSRAAPIERIPADVLELKAVSQYRKAREHLSEAKSVIASRSAPNSAARGAYYAMHHCAIAVLLLNGGVEKDGDVHSNHELVIDRFAKLVARVAPEFSDLAADLRQGKLDRVVADYVLDRSVTNEQAEALLAKAEHFLDSCEPRWKAS